ncbi:MAG: type II toxin-antitoxin system VapC family toxin [Gemmatimonadales bacterium]|nr:type II toxin-antitoxin system VapC family toxin [Gemmatimonadales bacterium]
MQRLCEPTAERKYVLDTNLFIRAFREEAANAQLQRFHQLFAPFEYLNAVVAQELRAGARAASARRQLERRVLDVYARRGRVVTPSTQVWHDSRDLLAELARQEEGLEAGRHSKAFGNDVLLALSCREAGLVLVTEPARL